MTIDQARELYRTKGGSIRAWALRPRSFYKITEELGFPTAEWSRDSTLWSIPIVLMDPHGPEGVIV
jgi:hypothetical protein